MVFAMGFTALVPLLDGLTFKTILGPGDEVDPARGPLPGGRTPYASVRVWGSVGWMVPGMGFAVLMLWALEAQTVAWIAMWTAAGFAGAGLATAWALPRQGVAPKGGGLPTAEAWRAIRRRPLAAMMAALVLVFTAVTIYFMIYPLYLRALGVPTQLMGLITNLGVVVEIGFMLGAGRLLGWLGVKWMVVMGMCCMVLRMALLVCWPTTATAVLTQLLHGPMVVALMVVPPMYLNHKASASFRNSIQGLYSVLCMGVTRIVGSIAAGYVSDWFGGDNALTGLRAALVLAGGLAAAGALTLWLAFDDKTVGHLEHAAGGG
jgi:MFS transporter, PPP family, 3-phenylpropionic acid transporter